MGSLSRCSLDLAVSRAREQDAALIAAIHLELHRPPPRQKYRTSEFLIAWHQDMAVGCAGTALNLEGGYFYGLAVRRDWQRQGIGGKLMEARLLALGALHLRYAVALAMFWNGRFFRKYGFAPMRRSELPESASVHLELRDPTYGRSAVMFRRLEQD